MADEDRTTAGEARIAARMKDYKPTLAESGTEKRRDDVAAARVDRRSRTLAKRRKLPVAAEAVISEAAAIEEVAALQAATTAAARVDALVKLRMALSAEEPPIQAVLKAGLVPLAIDSLQGQIEQERYEAAWCLANIAAGNEEQTEQVLAAAPYLIQLLDVHAPVVAEMAAFALGNIAMEGEDFRTVLIRNGASDALVRLLASKDIPLLKTAAWSVTNLLQGSAPAAPFVKAGVIELAGHCLMTPDAPAELLAECAWIFHFLCVKEEAVLAAVVTAGTIPVLLGLLSHASVQVVLPVVRSLGSICGGPDQYIDAVLVGGVFLAAIKAFLTSDSVAGALPKEAMWALSNVSAGTPAHRAAVGHAGLVPVVEHCLQRATFPVQREAVFVLANLCVPNPDATALNAIVTVPILEVVVRFLSAADLELVRQCLGFLELVFRKCNNGAKLIELANGMDALESLQYSTIDPALSSWAGRLVNEFFGDDYGQEDTADEPEPAGVGIGFTFPPPTELPPAGRGMHMTLPAWMATGAAASAPAVAGARQATLGEFGFGAPHK